MIALGTNDSTYLSCLGYVSSALVARAGQIPRLLLAIPSLVQ